MSKFMPRTTVFSFRTILIAIAIIGTLPVILFSAFLINQYADREQQRAERGLIESARGIARSIDFQFAAAEAALLALRDSTLLDTDDVREIEKRLRRTAVSTGRHFTLIQSDGQQIINTFQPEGAPLARNDPALWAEVFTDRHTVITNVFEGRTSKLLLAGVAVPVIRDNAVKFALATGMFSKDFADLTAEPGVPDEWIVSIVDRTGRHMIRSHNNEQFAGKPLVPALIEHMRSGSTGTLRTVSLEGIPLISTVQYAPRSKWAAAVGLPVTSLYAPAWNSLRDLTLAGLLVMALATAMAFLVARILDGAVGSLTEAATALGKGELATPPQSPVKEVNIIGSVLAQTSRDLDALTGNLEILVAKRTAELSDANAKLTAEIKHRQDIEAQVVQMQKIEAIGQLTGGIAHDFNNMLAVVLGSLRLLERRLQRGEANVQKYIDGAVEGAERAATLTRRLLAFSRQQPLAPKVIDSNKLISGMSEILRRTIPESIQIETVLAGGLWNAFADAPGLENAVINLAANARDAMPSGGKLTIETANSYLDDAYAFMHADVKAGQYVMIAIADTGVGMPPDLVARAVDPFFTTKPAGEGTGLGLSQVHGFVKQSNGHLKIYSEPGHGTTIKLYLPRHFGSGETEAETRSRPTAAPTARHGETVLVVEDEQAVRTLTIEMLRELGYVPLEAATAQAALTLLDTHPEIALLLTDVIMPGMNGRQLADEAQKARPGLAVLFTTGYTRNAIVHHGVLDPGVQVLIKPYSLDTLASKLSEVLPSA